MLKLRNLHLGATSMLVSILMLAATVGPTVSAQPTLDPITITGTVTLEPVLLPYCPPGVACPMFKKSFPYPYQLSIYRHLGAVELPVLKNADETGPSSKTFTLYPGTYDVRFNAGTLGVEYPQPIQIRPGQSAGILQLHFISRADGSSYFRDYNGCTYSLGSNPAPTNCQVQ